MPNRIIKESICSSDDINKLTPEEEIFFYRLITQVDDYGRLDARPQILRAKCFPLRVDQVTDDAIRVWLSNLAEATLIKLYNSNGKTYLQLTTWEKHQRIRAHVSKYPDPDGNFVEEAEFDSKPLTDDSKSLTHLSVIQSNPESRIQNPETESEIKKGIFVLPDWVNKDLWNDFLEVRKKQKKVPTERAKIELILDLKKLRDTGDDIDDVMLKSIKNNWLGFYSLKEEKQKGDSFKNKDSPIKKDDPGKYNNPNDYYGRHVQH